MTHTAASLVETTFVAVQTPGGWEVRSLSCGPGDVEKSLAAESLITGQLRVIGNCFAGPGAQQDILGEYALKDGWHAIRGRWYPLDEPLPRQPGDPQPSTVSLRLERIYFGIDVSGIAGAQTVPIFLDDIDDDLKLWVRFAKELEDGGFPHARLAMRSASDFLVQPESDDQTCRLMVRSVSADGAAQALDVVVNRTALIAEFKALLTAIADHPCFAHCYLLAATLPDDTYDAVSDAAETEWKTGVKQGSYLDEEGAMYDYFAHRIAEAVPLTDGDGVVVERYQRMLRTLTLEPRSPSM